MDTFTYYYKEGKIIVKKYLSFFKFNRYKIEIFNNDHYLKLDLTESEYDRLLVSLKSLR
jgi:hypothetical protein